MTTKTPPAPGFFKSIPASIYSPSFYAGIAGRSFWKGFWFFVGFTFLAMLLGSFVAIGVPYMTHREQIQQTIDDVVHFYPEELVVTIQDGKASTNVEEPYFIKFNDIIPTENWNDAFKEGFEQGMAADGPSIDLENFNAVVIDTKTPFSMEKFTEYSAIMWLTEDAVYVISENNKAEAIPLAESEDTVINKTVADEGMDVIWGGIKSFLPIVLVMVFLFTFLFVVIGRMIYLLLFSLIMLIVFSIMKLPYDYAAAYKIGFYAISLSLLVTIAFMAVGLNGFFLMGTLVSLLVAVINLDQAKKRGLIKEKKEKEA